ncbi:MAG: hypothetical protein ACXVXO_14900 [Mycobacteriaceae bacterium]
MSVPISHLLPLSNENRWSDLLAVLVEADPTSASTAFGLQSPLQHVRVRREVPTYGRDRLDLLISDSDGLRAVVEVKVLSGLGRGQLRRYRAAFPDAEQHVLIFPQRLPIHVAASTGWATLTWDRLLATFARSPNGWVAETALSWSDHLEHAMPRVDGQTGWNELRDGEDFVVAMRARMSWVFEALDPYRRSNSTWWSPARV